MPEYCDFCNITFIYKKSYAKHMEAHVKADTHEKNIHQCDYCKKKYSYKHDLKKHQKDCKDKKIHEQLSANEQLSIKDQLKYLQEQIDNQNNKINNYDNKILAIERTPKQINNNILQVVSVGSKDNYLDMLTERFGSFDNALSFIKNSALSSITGDCRLLEKIYSNDHLTNSNNANNESNGIKFIQYTNKRRTHVEYINEK